jgi:hypothetical protein
MVLAKIDVTEYLGSLYIISTFFAAIRDCPWEAEALNKTSKNVFCFRVSKLATPSVDLPADVRLLIRFMRSSAHVLYTKVKSNECTIFLSTTPLHSTCLEAMGGVFKQTLRKHANRHSAYHGSALSSDGTIIVESITPYNCSLCYTNMFL